MPALAQELAAYAAVCCAAIWLVWRWWSARHSRRGCAACGPTPHGRTTGREIRSRGLNVVR